MYTKTITELNSNGTYKTLTTLSGTFVHTTIKTITEIDKDGNLTVSEGKHEYDRTKDEFLSDILFTYTEKVYKNLKVVDEKNAVIDTEFGKRSVTIKSTETIDSGTIVKGKYYCGNDGIIYLSEAVTNINGYEAQVSTALKISSLLTIGS